MWRSRQENLTRLVLLGAMTIAAYGSSLGAGFIWDDNKYLTANPTLRDARGLYEIWFNSAATPQYYPLVHTSFWVEYHLWGLNATGYHAVNIGLHLLSAVLLWFILRRLAMPGAWLAAAIFALHPVHVESVARVEAVDGTVAVVTAVQPGELDR